MDGLEKNLGYLTSFHTFISDRQKSLVDALTKTFLSCQKSLCLKYLADNVRTKFRSHSAICPKLWAAARTYRTEKYEEVMKEIKSTDQEAYNYILKLDPTIWANNKVKYSRYGILTSNTSECFNAWVGEETRSLPVLCLFRHVIGLVAAKFCQRELHARQIEQDPTTVAPFARGKLKQNSYVGRRMTVLRTSTYSFLVTSGTMEYNVDVSRRHCACGHWEGLGYPCAHACACLLTAHPEVGMEVYSHVSDFFRTSKYQKCYTGSNTVAALSDPSTPIPVYAYKPPICTRQPRRPSKRR